jgi:hypothetical protein
LVASGQSKLPGWHLVSDAWWERTEMLGTKRRTYHHREATGRRHGHSRHRSPHGLLERLLPNDAVCVMVRCRWSGKSRESSWESRLTLRSEGGVEVGRRLWGVHCRFARKAPSASQKERRASRSGRVFGRVMPVSDSRWMKRDGDVPPIEIVQRYAIYSTRSEQITFFLDILIFHRPIVFRRLWIAA